MVNTRKDAEKELKDKIDKINRSVQY